MLGMSRRRHTQTSDESLTLYETLTFLMTDKIYVIKNFKLYNYI